MNFTSLKTICIFQQHISLSLAFSCLSTFIPFLLLSGAKYKRLFKCSDLLRFSFPHLSCTIRLVGLICQGNGDLCNCLPPPCRHLLGHFQAPTWPHTCNFLWDKQSHPSDWRKLAYNQAFLSPLGHKLRFHNNDRISSYLTDQQIQIEAF